MRSITGTHVYGWLGCPHAASQDLHEDRARRRAPTDVEELVLRRGRELEDRLVEPLGYSTPEFPERDFAAGAEATLELMRAGVPGILQGVLVGDGMLGIPDLLRRADGASDLGDHHYVVGDVKSSAVGRSDQVMQIMFYSRLLASVQGRAPDDAYLVLRDGHEENHVCADFDAALDDVLGRLTSVRDGETRTRPFLSRSCRSCHWSEVCLPELETRDDLSLLHGMTRGVRQVLEDAGISTCASVATMSPEPVARRTRLEPTLLRRLVKAALARASGRPVTERRSGAPVPDDIALVHVLGDAFEERVYWMGVLHPASADGRVHEAFPSSRAEELPAFLALLRGLPAGVPLWHHGASLPRWLDAATCSVESSVEIEARLVDLARRLRGAACYPGPVFGMDDHVRYVLGRDPERAGSAGAVALWMAETGAPERLAEKGRADLQDLAGLVDVLRRGDQTEDESGAPEGIAEGATERVEGVMEN